MDLGVVLGDLGIIDRSALATLCLIVQTGRVIRRSERFRLATVVIRELSRNGTLLATIRIIARFIAYLLVVMAGANMLMTVLFRGSREFSCSTRAVGLIRLTGLPFTRLLGVMLLQKCGRKLMRLILNLSGPVWVVILRVEVSRLSNELLGMLSSHPTRGRPRLAGGIKALPTEWASAYCRRPRGVLVPLPAFDV